jgi:hypothetical protein
LLEAREAVDIRRELGRKHLDRDVTMQPCVACAIDLAHAASAERRQDFVRPEFRADL